MESYKLLAVVVAISCVQYGAVKAQESVNVRRLTQSIGKFSQRLYTAVSTDTPNSIFSPYSVHTALSMAYLGARDDTAQEMKSVLEVRELDPHKPHGELIKNLNSVNNADVYIANSAWYNERYDIFDDYKNDLARIYDAQVERIVFNSPSKKPEEPINEWVAQKTKNNIKQIVEPKSLSPADTALVLVNTVYFNSKWSKQFPESDTKSGDFKREDGSTVKVNFMTTRGVFGYKESVFKNTDLLRVPFQNKRFAFYVFLPKTTSRLSDTENAISKDYSNADDWFKDVVEESMSITLPKFKLTASMELNESLKKMGMPTAFDATANFQGITDIPIYISKVVQKAVIDVREGGVTAAASTAVTFWGRSGIAMRFKVDRGFVYFIRDDETGNILFQGKFSDPTIKDVAVN